MHIRKIKGLKYPDEYFIRFFFKNRLHEKRHLRYLEFGCGNGNNLMLPYEYADNEVIGIDYNATLIEDAKHNFKSIKNNGSSYKFYIEDMRIFAKNYQDIYCDILSLSNIINYIPKVDFIKFLQNCKSNKLYKEKAKLFIRFRTPRDFRFGLGKRIDKQTYIIDVHNDITGEQGAMNCFYTGNEMIDILRKYLIIKDIKLFNIDFENLAKNDDIILNSDIVIWGTIS